MMIRVLAAALLAALSGSAAAAPHRITVVNGTGAPLTAVTARPENGQTWMAVTPGLSPGARTQINVDPDLCAYEVRATASGTVLTWRDVTLCETTSVTLSRRADGALWVDYD